MELFRNMEMALMLCFCLLCAASLFVRPPARTTAERTVVALPAGPMPVVVITGKRLPAAERRALARERA